MGTSVQVLRKAGWKEEGTTGQYDAPSIQMPFTSFTLHQSFDMIDDESIVGIAFPDLPLQGVRHMTGDLSTQLDVDTIEEALEGVFGSVAAKVFTLPTDKNDKTMSFVGLDEVKTYKYAGCIFNDVHFVSEAEGDLHMTAGVIGYVAEVRDDSAFPAMTTTPGTRLVHHHAGGTNGYIRIGNQDDALDSGDNQCIESIDIGVNWNYGEQYCNGQSPLVLLSSSAGRPEATFEFTISRHDADTWHGFRDNHTALQADINYYGAADAILQFEIPNFVIETLEKTEDDVNTLTVTCRCARNGIDANYSNSNMAFNSAIRASLTNT